MSLLLSSFFWLVSGVAATDGCGCGPNNADTVATPYSGSPATLGEVWETTALYARMRQVPLIIDLASRHPADNGIPVLDREHVATAWLQLSGDEVQALRGHSDRFSGWAVVNVDDPSWSDRVGFLVSEGAEGLVLDDLSDVDGVDSVLAFCDEYRLPVRIDADWSRPEAVEVLERFLVKYPRVRVVASRWLSIDGRLEEADRMLRTFPNLYVDTSLSGSPEQDLLAIAQNTSVFQTFALEHCDCILFASRPHADSRSTVLDLSFPPSFDRLRDRLICSPTVVKLQIL